MTSAHAGSRLSRSLRGPRPGRGGCRRRRPRRAPAPGGAGRVPAAARTRTRRLAVGRLRLGELAAEAMELPLAIVAPPDRPAARRPPLEPVLRAPRLVQCVLPRPGHLHDLRAMHQADAGVGDHLRLLLPPPRQRLGPLPGAPQLVDALAEVDRGAVDDPADDRRQPPGRHHHQRLVDQPHPFVPPPEANQGVALPHHRQRHQVRVPEALGDRRRLRRCRVRGLGVPPVLRRQQIRNQQVAVLDAFAPLLVRAAAPPGRTSRWPATAPPAQAGSAPPRTRSARRGAAARHRRSPGAPAPSHPRTRRPAPPCRRCSPAPRGPRARVPRCKSAADSSSYARIQLCCAKHSRPCSRSATASTMTHPCCQATEIG